MPKKASETMREQVVALRKTGATYAQIEAKVTNPETGRPIARPTTIKILREAGLTRPLGHVGAAKATTPSPSATTPSAPPSTSAPANSPLPVSPSDGVIDFMPKTKPTDKKAPDAEPVDFECEHCGAEFTADTEDDIPDECPECGN